MAKTIEVPALVQTVYFCESCEKHYDQAEVDEAGPMYECGECGSTFNKANSANNNNQCPDCNKFASRLHDVSCPEGCDDELQEVTALEYQGITYYPKQED